MASFCNSLYFITFLIFQLFSHPSNGARLLNILSYGAKINSLNMDSSKAIVKAWQIACESKESAIIYIPKGKYLVFPMAFKGDECKTSDITFHIDGALVGPSDYRILGNVNNWLSFEGVNGVSIVGGVLDAKGYSLWDCKANSGGNCPVGATSLSFINSNNIRINGLVSVNSQIFHIVVNGCQNVKIEQIKVIADENSPNTDGIHIQLSRHVTVTHSLIRTGDDCISIGPGTKNLWIQDIKCGPGHGISIGSLARDMKEPGVQNVTVANAVFVGTQNGLRIKSWARPSSGFVQDVQFLGALMQNVQNPIVIDQHYCPHNIDCPGQVSGVKISNVLYKDIRGTSATPVAIKFDCSSKNPCSGIRLEDVHLTYFNQIAHSSCNNAHGQSFGLVQPDGCL